LTAGEHPSISYVDPSTERAITTVLTRDSLIWSQIPVEGPPLSMAPDEWLSDQVVTEIYQTEYRSMVRLAILLVQDLPTAEDVVQDSFESVAHHRQRLRDPQMAMSYLRQAVVNRSRSVLRHRTVIEKNAPKPGPDEPSAESGALNLVERDEVVAALRRLPERQREALVLRYYGDFSEAEIAAAMGISRGAVKSHTARGMSALRQILERTDEIERDEAPSQMARESAVLATEVAPYVAAALGAYGPAVLSGEMGEVADAAIGAGRRMLQRIFGRRDGRDELPAVLAEVIEDPDDADYLAVLKLEIHRIVESDAAMQADIRAILRDVSPVVTVTQRVTAGRDVYIAGRDMTIARRPD
jgi:RNA polymerase sigma-70 factor (sigma-E family)